MNLEAEKIALIKQILQLEDEAVFARLQAAVRQTLRLPTLSDEEVAQQLREARQQAATGDTLSVADVTQLAQQWRAQ